MFTQRLIIIVAAAAAAAANAKAAEIDAEGGTQTFNVGLSPAGALPASHFWCSWQLTPAQEEGLRDRLAGAVAAGEVRIYDGTVVTPAGALAGAGLQPARPAVVTHL
jgi:hypothetical protein